MNGSNGDKEGKKPTGSCSARQTKILMLYTSRAIKYLMTFVFLARYHLAEIFLALLMSICITLASCLEGFHPQFSLGRVHLPEIPGEDKLVALTAPAQKKAAYKMVWLCLFLVRQGIRTSLAPSHV